MKLTLYLGVVAIAIAFMLIAGCTQSEQPAAFNLTPLPPAPVHTSIPTISPPEHTTRCSAMDTTGCPVITPEPTQNHVNEAKRASDLREAEAIIESAQPTIHIESKTSSWNSYGGLEVSGVIHNKGIVNKAVFGYVDCYNSADVKEDSAIFSAKPDAYGKATFKTVCQDVSHGGTYEVRIINVYNN